MLAVVLLLSLNPMNVRAEGCPKVTITCNAAQTKAKGKYLLVYFENIETGETISRRIHTNGFNEFTDIPVGEYEYIKSLSMKKER